jgi:hypothetical protein
MAGMLNRLKMLSDMRRENITVLLANARDSAKDKNGSASASVASTLRFLGVADYVLKGDIVQFKSNLAQAAEIRLNILRRFMNGEPISRSYISMLNYKSLCNALAACDMGLAKSLAIQMGGRKELEKEYDHPFDYALGYALRAFVLGEEEDMGKWASEFAAICEAKENLDFAGYAEVFQGILQKDVDMVKNGLKSVVKGHAKQSKGKGVFSDSEDELLCIWGVGIANLARAHGMVVDGEPPLIPNDLLC